MDMHTEHCCQIHGCKYDYKGDPRTCTVTSLAKPQSFPCEFCAVPFGDEDEYARAWELNDAFNAGTRWAYTRIAEYFFNLKEKEMRDVRTDT